MMEPEDLGDVSGGAGSGYFRPEEFLCKCGRRECDAPKVVSSNLLSRLNLLRTRVQRPLIVSSGLRCKFWNEHEGGESQSGHLTGDEVDVVCTRSADRWELIAANFEGKTPLFERIGMAKTFLHFGVSTSLARRVVWLYPPPKPKAS